MTDGSFLPYDPIINRRVVSNIIARCGGKSLNHLHLIPLLYSVGDTTLSSPVGVNFALGEPLLEDV